MAAPNSWTSGAASAEIIAADVNRDYLTIQSTTANTVALGFGHTAVAGKGVQLIAAGDTVTVRGWLARLAVNAIGASGAGTYQDGDIAFTKA